jgi:hypothetical protein
VRAHKSTIDCSMLRNPDGTVRSSSRKMLPLLSATKVATILIAGDSAAILASAYLTYDRLIIYSLSQNLYLVAAVFVWLVALSLINFVGLYRYEAAAHPIYAFRNLFVALSTAFLFLLAAAFSIKVSSTFSRLWLGFFFLASCISVTLVRLGMSFALTRLLTIQSSKRNLAIVGTGEQCQRFFAALAVEAHSPFHVLGVFSDQLVNGNVKDGDNEVISSSENCIDDLISQARNGLVDDVVIALPWQEDNRIMSVVSRLRELPVNVYLASDLVGFRTKFHSPPSHFGALPVLQVMGKPMSDWDAAIKKAEDFILAPVLLALAAPLLLGLAIAIKLDSWPLPQEMESR